MLVVGAGNSGAEIAMELAPHHQTWLSGPDTGQEPTRAGSLLDHLVTPIMWLVATRLTVKTALGRKLRDHFLDPPRGIPLGRVRRKDFSPAGIERVPRMTGVRNGYPVLEDGRVLEVSNVIWCTGFTPNYDWINLPLQTHNGFPIHDRGIVESCPGLYFIGLPFLYSLSSALVGGVGRDAKHIVNHIVSTAARKNRASAARARRSDGGRDEALQFRVAVSVRRPARPDVALRVNRGCRSPRRLLVDGLDHVARLHVRHAVATQASQARCGTQLQRPRSLPAGHLERLLETLQPLPLRHRPVRRSARLSPETTHFGRVARSPLHSDNASASSRMRRAWP